MQVVFLNCTAWLSMCLCVQWGVGGSWALDITSTGRDAIKVVLLDDKLRMQLVNAFTEDNRLHRYAWV